MFIKSWQAEVRVPEEKYRQEPQLRIKAVLRCPACGNDDEFSHRFPAIPAYVWSSPRANPLPEALNAAATALGQARFCSNCGVNSNMPPKDLGSLQASLRQLVSQYAVRACIEELSCEVVPENKRAPSPSEDTYTVDSYRVPPGKSGTVIPLNVIALV